MKLLKKEDFVSNFDFYSDLVHDKKETIIVRLDNGSFIQIEPVNENETR